MSEIKLACEWTVEFGGEEHSGWLPEGAATPKPRPIRRVDLAFVILCEGPESFILEWSGPDRETVAIGRGTDFTVYRAARLGVYVSPLFPRALEGDAVLPATLETIEALGTLFRRGALTGDMFLTALGHDNTE